MKKLLKLLGISACWLVGFSGVGFLGYVVGSVTSCSKQVPKDTSGFTFTKQGDEYIYIVSWPYFELNNIPKGQTGYQSVECYKDGQLFATYTREGEYNNWFLFQGDGYYTVELKTFIKNQNNNGGIFEVKTLAKGKITKENWNEH